MLRFGKMVKIAVKAILIFQITTLLLWILTGIFNSNTQVNLNSSRTIFDNYNVEKPPVYFLKEDKTNYFQSFESKGGQAVKCFIEGTDIKETIQSLDGKSQCVCKKKWYGKWCSFPQILKSSSTWNLDASLLPRVMPRRIISAFPFSYEFDLTECRFEENGDVVDVFMLGESNYTGYGEPKPLHLLNKLKAGFAKAWHEKLIYVFLGTFPKNGRANGWLADVLFRDHLGLQGIRRQVKNIREDDLFILHDADEIVQRDILLFLKLHDGYSEPFGFVLKKTVFGFFWKADGGVTEVMAGVSLGMLSRVYGYKAMSARRPSDQVRLTAGDHPYFLNHSRYGFWIIGSSLVTAGWHCSWCFKPEIVAVKLSWAINADLPRWGDFADKKNVTYISNLIRTGTWFDGQTKMKAESPGVQMYAPPFIMKHESKYRYLIINPNKYP